MSSYILFFYLQIIMKQLLRGESKMKRCTKTKYLIGVIMLIALLFCGCGMNGKGQNNAQNENDKVDLYSPGEFGDTTGEGITTEKYNTNSEENEGNNLVSDVVKGTEEAVDDIADGVGDAIDNLGGGSFDSYDEAKKYLLEKLQKDNAGAIYEIREENKDLTAYNHNDSGAEGYRFSVYETDNNEKIGIYYVDKDTGKIYRYMGKNSIEAY